MHPKVVVLESTIIVCLYSPQRESISLFFESDNDLENKDWINEKEIVRVIFIYLCRLLICGRLEGM